MLLLQVWKADLLMLKSTLHKLARKSLGTALATAAAVSWGSSASAQEPEPLPPLLDNSAFGSPETVFDASGRQCGGWSASVEALWLKRKTLSNKLLAAERNVELPGMPAVNSLSIDTGSSETEAAWKLTLVREFDDCSRLEFIYFELNDVPPSGGAGSGSQGDPGFDFGFNILGGEGYFLIDGGFDVFGGFSTDAGDVVGGTYRSDLRNIEFNYDEVIRRTDSCELSLGVGVRYLHLDENFSLFANEADGTLIDRLDIRASNHMLGLQLKTGLDVQLSERFSLNAGGKAGLLLNTATQSTSRDVDSRGFSENAGAFSESDRDYGMAGVLETSVQVRGQLCDNVSVMAGYSVFYLSGLALAPEQLTSNTGSGSPGVDSGGESLYYGPTAGVEITWGGGR